MTLTEKIKVLREKYNAMELRKARAYSYANNPYSGSMRFVFFIHSLERSRRIGSRFALHLERVERAAETPVASYVRFLMTAEPSRFSAAEVA